MSTFTTKDGTVLFYKEWGNGLIVIFSHGWPLSSDARDWQMLFLGRQGYRVIAHAASSAWRAVCFMYLRNPGGQADAADHI